MAIPTETRHAATASGVTAKGTAAAVTSGAVSTFSEVLQVSLQDSVGALVHGGHTQPLDIKSRSKSAPGESPRSDAPPAASAMLSANPITAAPLNLPVTTNAISPMHPVPEFSATGSSDDSSAVPTEDAASQTWQPSSSFSSRLGTPTASGITWPVVLSSPASQPSSPTLSAGNSSVGTRSPALALQDRETDDTPGQASTQAVPTELDAQPGQNVSFQGLFSQTTTDESSPHLSPVTQAADETGATQSPNAASAADSQPVSLSQPPLPTSVPGERTVQSVPFSQGETRADSTASSGPTNAPLDFQPAALSDGAAAMSLPSFFFPLSPVQTKSGSFNLPNEIPAPTASDTAIMSTAEAQLQPCGLSNAESERRSPAVSWKVAAGGEAETAGPGASVLNQIPVAAFTKNVSRSLSQLSQTATNSNATPSSAPITAGGASVSDNTAVAPQATQTAEPNISFDLTAHKTFTTRQATQSDTSPSNESNSSLNNSPNSSESAQRANSASDNLFSATWNPAPSAHTSDLPPSPAANLTAASMPGSDPYNLPKAGTAPDGPASSHAQTADDILRQLADEGPVLSAGLQAWNSGENLQGDVTQASHLAVKAGQSEMNIAMQAEALGAVQVRTHVTGDQVGAAITVERHDAHAFLTSDLPALHQALNDRQLRPENISVSQGSSHTGAGIGDGTGRQHPQDRSPQRSFYSGGTPLAAFSGAQDGSMFADITDTRTAFDSSGRLSVQA
jgi:flagellar hook-length control protein FliK